MYLNVMDVQCSYFNFNNIFYAMVPNLTASYIRMFVDS